MIQKSIRFSFICSVIISLTSVSFAVGKLVKQISIKQGHWINWTATSHDGSVVAAATYKPNQLDDFEFYLMSDSGKVIFKDTFEGYTSGAFWVALSGDGKKSAVGGLKERHGSTEIGFVRAYENSQNVFDAETQGRVNALQLSADGDTLVVGAGNRSGLTESFTLFEYHNGHFSKADFIQRASGCRSTALSDDGTRAVCGRFDGVVEIFHIENSKFVQVLQYKIDPSFPQSTVRFVNITPDGRWVVASGNNSKFYLFDVTRLPQKLDPVWSFQSSADQVYGVSISSDGKFIAAGSSDGEKAGNGKNLLQIVENKCTKGVCRPAEHWTFTPDRAPNPGMCFDQSGRWLTLATGYPVGTPGSFYLFDVQKKQVIMRHQAKDMNWPFALSRNGKTMVGGSDDSSIYIFKNE